MIKHAVCCIAALMYLLAGDAECCTLRLCETHCDFGYYNTTIVTSWGQPCNCLCCPPLVCRMCVMRKKIISQDEHGCTVCRCGWLLK